MDQEESLSSLMAAYSKVGMTGQEEKKADDKVSEEEAMLAFSSAKLNGVKVMDLPDADPNKKEKQLTDQQEIAVFQANEIEKQQQEETKKTQQDQIIQQGLDSKQSLEQ